MARRDPAIRGRKRYVRCDSPAHDPHYERILRQNWRFNRRSAELTVEGLLAQIAKTRVTPRSRGLFLNRLINTSPTRLRCLTMINEQQRIKVVAGARTKRDVKQEGPALKLLSLTRTDAIA